jgi:PAS domain S-box-containing protein
VARHGSDAVLRPAYSDFKQRPATGSRLSLAPTKAAPQQPVTGISVNLAIIFFNLALMGAVWIAALEVVRIDREETINAAIDRNDNLAIAFQEYTVRTIESADAVLQYMIREYARSSGKIDLDRFVTDYTIDHKAFTGIVLANEKGEVASTTQTGRPAKPVNVADREHFSVHITKDSASAFIGKPVIGRLTNKLVIPISRRINKPDGSFGGVAIVLIEPTRFTDLLHEAKMKNLDIITLIGTDGILRARLKGMTTTAGENVSQSPVFKLYPSRPNGHYFAKGQVDGIPKFFSYRTLPDYQLIAVVAAAESDVLADFSRRQRYYFWAAGISSALIAGFALLLIIALTRQRRADVAVARNQARFLATFNQAAVGITHTDIHGRLIEVNQKFCDIVGYSREELLGHPFSDITHPDDLAENLAVRRKITALSSGKDVSPLLEKRYIRKDGSIVWCLLNISAVRNAAGDIDYLVAITQDISQRRAAEQALKILEQEQRLLAKEAEAERARLAEAQAVAKIGSWETRLPELTVVWSAETYRIFEVDADGFQPTHAAFLEFVHADDRAKVDAAFAGSLADPSSHSIEHRIVMRDGSIKTVEERWRTFQDDQGQPVRVAGTCQDITEKKKADEDRAQLAAIVESSNDAIVSRSLDGVIVSWNQAAERMFGWTAAEAIGRPPQIMTPPDYVGKFSHLIDRVKRGETTEPFETVRVRKNGERFDAQVCLSAVKGSSGEVIGIATIVRDISDRKRAEQAQAQLAAIVESSNDAIISRDLNRIIISWNPTAERLFGWNATEALGQSINIITPPELIGKLSRVIQQLLDGKSVVPIDTVRQRKDGSRFEAQISLSPLRDGNGKVIGIATIIRDITERKRAEAALRDYAAQMRHLSWRLSEVEERERRNIHRELHDQVGANLAALKLDLGLINNMLATDTPKTISDRLKKTQQLTGETIARIRDVMADLRPPALDDYGLLAALRNHAQPYSARLGIPVLVDGEDIQPRLAIAVETALFRIAQEALSNITKHAQAHHVGITVSATDDSVTLVIADDGIGFDAGRIDPHQAAWGLRTMRERAQAIAAGFRLESSPGKGTRVIVELPRKRV